MEWDGTEKYVPWTILAFCFSLLLQEKFLVAEKFPVSSIANIMSLQYFKKLGCDSLYHTINQDHRQSLLSSGAHEFTVGKLVSIKVEKI